MSATMGGRRLDHRLFTGCVIAAVLSTASARAAEADGFARAVSVQGTVETQRAGASAWTPVKLDDTFAPGDVVRTGPRSRAVIALLDRSVLRLGEGATVTLRPPGPGRSGLVDLVRGALHILTRGPRSLDVKTELVSVGVRGTEFLVLAEADATSVSVFEGAVHAENAQGAVDLAGGQTATARRGQPPVIQIVARPRDAVRWALHYPPVLDVRAEDLAAEPAAQDRLRVSLTAWRQGDVASAFAALPEVPATAADVRLLTYRAQLLLAVGRVDEAGADLDRALAAAPRDAGALSLQAVVAVVQNDRDRALQLGRAAVDAAPSSATAHLALSYAQQARFDLRAARASALRAAALDPKDALAWARVAELHASFGDRADALAAARKASALAPDLSRTRTVLGFARLADVDPRGAEQEFSRAIALDSADPLPRLGLGLARVRLGELDRGARDLEIAATLAPNDALVRSYLGKAYFEEKRGIEEREYATARDLDPRDPTPWFYGAISKQASNRPVEALWDLEQANALNDGRGVYRSRLLLDSDLAARSASLARIYGDLGFQQLALSEGWRSVEADPSSDSAHRLLADSYGALPRHEVARVSELLQAQLLQPINITPIQPRLGESNLFLAGRAGAATPSFNEFNPVFERDRAVGQVNWFGGDRSTVGVEPVVAALYRNLAVSAGYSGFWTDGARPNSDEKDRIASVFAQAELSSQTSVQAEYRYRDVELGYLQSQFFQDTLFVNQRQTLGGDTFRVGARHAFTPGSVVLASAMYQRALIKTHNEDIPTGLLGFDFRQVRESGSGELQHILRTRWVDLVTGGGFFRITGNDRTAYAVALPPPPFGPGGTLSDAQVFDRGVKHGDAYAYAHLRPVETVKVTLGASGDEFRSTQYGDRSQLNPKVGVTWAPFAGTTIRAAGFRVLKRTLITDQTLEPTQVAGFTQFFDDANGSRSWCYGAGLDQRLARGVFAGVEGTRRDLDVPVDLLSATAVGRSATRWHETQARGYLFWTPATWIAVRSGYGFERLNRNPDSATLGVQHADTHRVPLGVSLFHPSGLGASATATWFRQKGAFDDGTGMGFLDGSDRFWLLDAGVTWRLPRRSGTFAVVGTNLLDKRFKLFENGINNVNSTVQPARAVFARVTLAAP
jgi:tetratricopeptide (TPR) repeat protein